MSGSTSFREAMRAGVGHQFVVVGWISRSDMPGPADDIAGSGGRL
jgi:hypothetical protein